MVALNCLLVVHKSPLYAVHYLYSGVTTFDLQNSSDNLRVTVNEV